MKDPLNAAFEIHDFLTSNNIPYVIIGGLATQFWGEPRFTQDVDITILIPLDETDKFIGLITNHFESRVANDKEFAKQNRMVLIKASDGTEIDISLGIPGYEDEVMRRAIDYEIEPGKELRLCSAEDLVIHKMIAGRPIDLQDIEGIIIKQGQKLDRDYITNWLKQFAQALERPVDKHFEELLDKSNK
ncbi:MAG: hypothetical protein C4562_04110 [Actinobacteria bacterium]|nr:MAG: hypothetical protein C4562_04110 [Actinomycetota bacterium]